MRWRGPGIAAVCVILAACGRAERAPEAAAFKPLDIGGVVPVYAARGLAGDTVRVGGHEGVTVLNVWATWCTSCQEEMASLDSLRTEYARRGLRVVAVSVDNGDVAKVRRFAETNHLGMIVAHDPDSEINAAFQVVGVPTTFIVGRDGRLVWRHTGNVTEVMAEARAAIERALGAN